VALVLAGRAEGQGPAYRAEQFRCVRVHQRITSEITTETGTRRATARTGRDGELIVAGRPDTAGTDVLAFFDRLAVWRSAAGDSSAADAEGILGGRFRGTLAPDGRYTARARPFVPEAVRELSDVGAALDEHFALLPPRALQVGEEWRAGDSLGIQRLADSAGLERYRIQRTTEGRVLPAAGDTVTPPFDRVVSERGTLAWHPLRGALRWDRRVEAEVLVPASAAVKRPVRSRIEQRAVTALMREDPRACAGLAPDE
jgi:hypothetical protein